MGTLMLFTSLLTLSTLTHWVNSQERYHQIGDFGDLSKYGYNIYSYGNGGQNYEQNIPFSQTHQVAQDRAGYNFGNNYGRIPKNIPVYTEKKITTIRKLPVKKQLSNIFNTVLPFKPGQLQGRKSNLRFNNNQYGTQAPSFGNNQINWIKGGQQKNENFDFQKIVNEFNKQLKHIDLKVNQNIKQEHPRIQQNIAPSFNDNKNKLPFDYIPVNLDSKINNFNPFTFNTDLKIKNNGNNKPSTINLGWNQRPVPIKSKPVKYETFVPRVSGFDASRGKITNHDSQNFESFHGQGKGGDPSSFVKVTNGNVTYSYNIKHLLNRH